MPSIEQYDREFELERAVSYPAIDDFESAQGFAVPRARLEAAARVLACPIKTNPPCWQHGRVLYTTARFYLRQLAESFNKPELKCFVDVGTAKGFSALCLKWAAEDAKYFSMPVVSVDVIDPEARVQRNTPAEVEGFRTLAEILAPWREAQDIKFVRSTGQEWLRKYPGRVCFAFIDGKHSHAAVDGEMAALSNLQRSGDMVVLDDLQIDGVREALGRHRHSYTWMEIAAKPAGEPVRPHGQRVYAVAMRR